MLFRSHTLEGIYQQLNLDSWSEAAGPIRRRIEARSDYRAKPIKLEPKAEALLQELVVNAGLSRDTTSKERCERH